MVISKEKQKDRERTRKPDRQRKGYQEIIVRERQTERQRKES